MTLRYVVYCRGVRSLSNWYQESRQIIVELYGDDADLFCDILAATSPRRQVKANWNMSVKIYDEFKKTGGTTVGMMPSHQCNVFRALSGNPLHGWKVPAFAANLKGDLHRVTIDMWVMDFFGLTQRDIRRLEYYRMEAAIQKLAYRRRMMPAEYQAMIWCKAVERAGLTPVSYRDVHEAKGAF